MSRPPTPALNDERALLLLALGNSARSVLLLMGALGYVVYCGFRVGATGPAGLMLALGAINAGWRWLAARHFNAQRAFDEAAHRRGVRMVECSALLAGLTWVVGSVGIYPHLSGPEATAYGMIVVGSIAVAATFMGLVGRAFLILSSMQLGALAAISLWNQTQASWATAVLLAVFGVTMNRASVAFRHATQSAMQQRGELDLANNALRDALQAAEAANIAKSQFLATMSHEIRTPMNGVLGALDLLRRTPLAQAQRRMVRNAAVSGEALLGILNDVLDHSKIEAGKLELASAPMSLRAGAQSVIGLFRGNAESKGLALVLEVAPDTPDRVIGDAQRVKQVLLNLVGNAVKFTDSGTVTLSLRPALAPAASGVGVLFEVHDTGVGISPGDCQRIFEPFEQAGVLGGKARRSGTGLGLSISQHIVKTMGGTIEVKSVPGRGSTFAFALAFEPDEETSRPLAEDTAPGELDSASQMRGTVLLVEDNIVNRMIASEMLRNMGLEVLQAEDGAEAVFCVQDRPVDLVLMDVQMPVMDGYEATQKIRELEARHRLPRLPVIAVTANASESDAAHARDVGMDGHLAKPFTQAKLKAVLETYL